jgi:hypothetical protein
MVSDEGVDPRFERGDLRAEEGAGAIQARHED